MTLTLPASGAALVLIDIQLGFDDPVWGVRNNPDAEDVCGQVLEVWRRNGWPVLHIQHDSNEPGSPLTPGSPGHPHKSQVTPRADEAVLHKTVNSAFIETDLEQRLRDLGSPGVVFCGLTTDHCVSTTTRMSANLGFETWLVADGCATFARTGPNGELYAATLVHDVALASLNEEFATVLTSNELLAAAD